MSKAFSKEKLQYMLYTISHPMDGFYWIRHAEKGSVPLAIVLVFLFSVAFTANRLLASFIVNDLDPRGVDSLYELMGVMMFYLLICVGNWAVTCLMEGEGRLKDIAIAVGYSTFPISIVLFVGTIMSQMVSNDEAAFYTMLIGVGIAYGLILMLIGIMQVHNYTLGKTLITLFLTFIAMLIIIFVVLLISNMLSMVVVFFKSIYTEIIFWS